LEAFAMMWYGGDGWGWGGVIVNVLAMVVFWGAVITVIVFAVWFRSGERSDPWAPRDTGSTRAKACWRHVVREAKWTTANFTAE
jgi:hypothetical protein